MTGVGQSDRYRRRGGVRIEYVIAAAVCVALLLAMTVVLVSVSNRKAKMELTRRPLVSQGSGVTEPEPVRPTPSPAPTPTPMPGPVVVPTPVPAPVPAPMPAPVTTVRPGGPQLRPGAVEVVVEDLPQTGSVTQTTPEPVVVVVDTPQPVIVSAQRGAYPDGRPRAVAADAPTRIQAEDYDTGGEGVAYHDLSSQNEGGLYRLNEGMDVGGCDDTGSRYAVSYIRSGEWLDYTLNVEQSGVYVIRLRAARANSGEGKVKIHFGGIDATGEVPIASTGDWQKFTSAERDNVELTAGEQVMRVEVTNGDFNLNWIEIIPAAAYVAPLVATDNLEELRIGGRPTGAEWDFGVTGGTVTIQQSPLEDTKCLRLQDSNRNAGVWALRSFPKQTQQAGFECRVRYGQVADGYALGILGGDKPAVLMYTLGNELVCEVSDKESKTLQRYEPNKWYTIRIALDIKSRKYNVYVDGVQRGEGLAFRNGVDGVDKWQAEIPARTIGTMYLNAMKVTER